MFRSPNNSLFSTKTILYEDFYAFLDKGISRKGNNFIICWVTFIVIWSLFSLFLGSILLILISALKETAIQTSSFIKLVNDVLIVPSNRLIVIIAVWIITFVSITGGRFATLFLEVRNTGICFWTKKYLMTVTNGRIRIGLFHLTGRIFFYFCASQWLKNNSINFSASWLWERHFMQRRPFFSNALIQNDNHMSKFRAWLNDYDNRKYSPFQYVFMIIIALYSFGSILSLPSLITAGLVYYPNPLDNLDEQLLFLFATTYLFLGTGLITIFLKIFPAFAALEQTTLFGWFDNSTKKPCALPSSISETEVVVNTTRYSPSVLGICLIWTWLKYLKRTKIPRNFPAYSKRALRKLIEIAADEVDTLNNKPNS